MTATELNERYPIVRILWKPDGGIKFIYQPGIFHTIQDALIEIAKISNFNITGIYHIVTPYSTYEITDIFQMKLNKIKP